MRTVGAVVLASLLLAPTVARADAFWSTWGDGKAELDGYALVQPRYGTPRKGHAVLIFVTEDFSDSLRVKADPGRHPPSDVYPVMKLNFVRRFQTGIYDYAVLTSTFVRTEPTAELVKISLSVQEWCGHVYQQWLRRGTELIGVGHSYFDGEADSSATLTIPSGALFEDALPILVRGLRGPLLQPGETRELPFFGATVYARFAHRPQTFTRAKLSRAAKLEPYAALGRTIFAEVYTVEAIGGPTTRYFVEPDGARRLLGWTRSDGERGVLKGSARLPYWQMNGEGGEAALEQLGLRPIDGDEVRPSRPR